jgi:hypothetical protein
MYTLTPSLSVVHEGSSPSSFAILRDCSSWEHFGENKAPSHFCNIHAFLMQRIEQLHKDDHYMTEDEENELRFILDALIQSKRLLQEK